MQVQHVLLLAHVQGLAAVLLFAKDARGNVTPHAFRLQQDASGTVLSPLLVAPANLADPARMAAKPSDLRADGGEESQAGSGNAEAATEHGFWSANASTWSPDGNLASMQEYPCLYPSQTRWGFDRNDMWYAGASGAEIQQVLTHRGSGMLIMRWGPSRPWALPTETAITALSAADALVAKQLLRMSVMTCAETVHASSGGPICFAPMHTGLTFWGLESGR